MTPSEFKARFPFGEFNAVSGDIIQTLLDQAAPMFNVVRWGDFYSEGLANYVAHAIVVGQARATRGIGQPSAGTMTSKNVGPVGASYDAQLLNKQADDTFMASDYGQRYCELRNLVGMGGISGGAQ